MADIKQQIIDWFNSSQDYEAGVLLLEQTSKKNRVISKLMKRGETRSSFEKLIWELNKVAGLSSIPERKKTVAKVAAAKVPKLPKFETKQPEKTEKLVFNLIGDKDINSYPPEVNRLVKEYSALYMERGKKHSSLVKLGDGNDQATVNARKVIIDEIDGISKRMEELYEAFHDYDENEEPVHASALWPDTAPKASAGPAISESVESLKNQKKNIQSSITKDRNLLLYGSKTKPKDGKEKPMPAGPKRTTLEKRITKKDKEILEIDQRIADLS